MDRTWEIIGAPYDLSANEVGASAAPAFVRENCCPPRRINMLREKWGISLLDGGDVEATEQTTESNSVENLSLFCDALHQRIRTSYSSGNTPVVIGGDHSISIGSISGAAAHVRASKPDGVLGVIWVDAHADLNTREGDNLHGRAASVLLGLGPHQVTDVGGFAPKVRPEHLIQIGIREMMPSEYKVICERGVQVHPMQEIDRRGLRPVCSDAIESLEEETDAIFISVDIDVCQGELFGACAAPKIGGLSARELFAIAELARASDKFCGIDIVEFCPAKDIAGHTGELLSHFLDTLVGCTEFFTGGAPTEA